MRTLMRIRTSSFSALTQIADTMSVPVPHGRVIHTSQLGLYGIGAVQPIGLTQGAAAISTACASAFQQSMLIQDHTCAFLDVASEIVSEIESEMGLEAPRR